MSSGDGLPSGHVTFLFTDIEGSTALLRTLGPDFSVLMDQHDQILRSVWSSNDGHEFGTEGDSFFVAFADQDAALRAAVDAQEAMCSATWPQEAHVRVRVGLHTGSAHVSTSGTYRALAVHQAARIMACANGGQVLASAATVDASPRAPNGYRATSIGHFRIRDFDEPVSLYQISRPGRPLVDTPIRARPADGHNLLRPVNDLIGRENERSLACAALIPGALVTIVGHGGVGKTRLATAVGLDMVGGWPDGVWFADLSGLVSVSDAPHAIAEALGVALPPERDTLDFLIDHFADMRCMLIVDNCEQLLPDIASLITALHAASRGSALLVTSRRPLDVRGEVVLSVDGLAAQSIDDPAIALLRACSDGRADRFDDEAIVALCAALDGLPVALEIAARRIRTVDPAGLLEQIRRDPQVLTSHDPTLPERHRSLDRLFEWTEQLLPPDSRRLLDSLHVISAGFDLHTAERVCAGDALREASVGPLLWSLVDASLVRPDGGAGRTRYRMLETVRQYVGHRVADAERRAAIRRYAGVLASVVGPNRPIDRDWVAAMTLEADNVRHCVMELSDGSADDVRTAQTLAWSIAQFHDRRDTFRLGVAEVGRLVGHLTATTPERVSLLAALADLHLRIGDVATARTCLDEASAIRRDVGLPDWDEIGGDLAQGAIALHENDPAAAVALAHALDDRVITARARARAMNLLGIGLYQLGDAAGAADAFQREIADSIASGMETSLAVGYSNLAAAQIDLGDHRGAAASQLASIDLQPVSRDPVLQGFLLSVAAQIAAADDDWTEAIELQRGADVLIDRAGFVLYERDRVARDRLLRDALSRLDSVPLAASASTEDGDWTTMLPRAMSLLRRHAGATSTAGGT